ncbi:MAG: hypothetical protein V7L23_12575 [Nostoc sp.]|uniref:hypothetical protein n=1 Tax=Nostoc sp. TaxID=1180 RepID=UPI002FEF5AF4
MTQFQQETEQFNAIKERLWLLLSDDQVVKYENREAILARTYFAIATLKQVFHDLDGQHENQNHHL